MTQYFYHKDRPDVRMKICEKTIVFEQQKDALWGFYSRLSLPLINAAHAKSLQEKYKLTDEESKRITYLNHQK
jgi:hypothetical protein